LHFINYLQFKPTNIMVANFGMYPWCNYRIHESLCLCLIPTSFNALIVIWSLKIIGVNGTTCYNTNLLCWKEMNIMAFNYIYENNFKVICLNVYNNKFQVWANIHTMASKMYPSKLDEAIVILQNFYFTI
jgi:hypothetical protein